MKLGNDQPTGAPRYPRGVYQFTIPEEPVFKLSKAKNKMLVFVAECSGPASKMVDGQEVDPRGWQFQLYAVFKEDGSNPTLAALHKALNLPDDIDLDPETGLPVGIQYTGQMFSALAGSQEQDMLDENDEIIRHPSTGEPLKTQRRQIHQILS